jgi:hypothetical protein
MMTPENQNSLSNAARPNHSGRNWRRIDIESVAVIATANSIAFGPGLIAIHAERRRCV